MKTAGYLVWTLAVALAGCATAPQPLRGEFSALSPEQARDDQPQTEVRWGGSIISTLPGATETCIEVLGRELNESARPRLSPDRSSGRFLACRAGFYDPAIFTEDREVTVTGRLTGFESRRIGDYEYRYPRVAADVIYLWPERRALDDYHWHHDPFWPGYRPFWWGGYRYYRPFFPHPKEVRPPEKASG